MLLDSKNPTYEEFEAVKLIKVAAAYKNFISRHTDATLELKKEAYRILRIAFDGGRFPKRKYLSKAQFGQLLDLHLHYETL